MQETWAKLTLVDVLDQALEKYADRVASVSFGHGTTYAELDRLSRSWAGWLRSLDLPSQSRVAIMLPNVTSCLVALIGTLRAGHVVVNINPLYTARELTQQLRDSKSQVIVVFEAFAHTLQQVPIRDRPEHMVVVRVGDLLPKHKSLLVNFAVRYIKRGIPAWRLPEAIGFTQALRKGAVWCSKNGGIVHGKTCPQDLAFIQYTGGTTGEPKGAMLTQSNLVANIMQIGEVARPAIGHLLDRQLTMLTVLPLYHVFAMTICALYALHAGMKIVLVINGRDIASLLKILKAYPPSIFPGVNTLFATLLRQKQFRELDFSGLVLTLAGGMAVHQQVAQEWQKVTGKPIIQGYGMSETSPVICANPMDSVEFSASVGYPLPMTEVRVLDDEHKPLPSGQIGEIAVRGPQVMKGYWCAEEETAQSMTRNGYFLTGDMGYIDERGCVTLVDRKKDMILVSGFNVYPAELDAVFSEHPDVLECAAVGYPDMHSGECIRLFVVPRVKDVDLNSLRQWSQQRLTPYKRPKEMVLVDSLPKNAVGKTLRRMLRQLYP